MESERQELIKESAEDRVDRIKANMSNYTQQDRIEALLRVILADISRLLIDRDLIEIQ